jgi:hypothetical protein
MSGDFVQLVQKPIAASQRAPLETVTIDSAFAQCNIDSIEILAAAEVAGAPKT